MQNSPRTVPIRRLPKLSPARIRALHALAKRIDVEEQPAIKSRARRAFAQHQTIRTLIDTLKSRRLEQHLTFADTLQRYAHAIGMKVRVTLN